ncbi:MAG: hypothetical protein IOD12_04210 [Silvanigrellales bacterium]|nr:hypothetical protein [Silvanigrellales bacterium]
MKRTPISLLLCMLLTTLAALGTYAIAQSAPQSVTGATTQNAPQGLPESVGFISKQNKCVVLIVLKAGTSVAKGKRFIAAAGNGSSGIPVTHETVVVSKPSGESGVLARVEAKPGEAACPRVKGFILFPDAKVKSAPDAAAAPTSAPAAIPTAAGVPLVTPSAAPAAGTLSGATSVGATVATGAASAASAVPGGAPSSLVNATPAAAPAFEKLGLQVGLGWLTTRFQEGVILAPAGLFTMLRASKSLPFGDKRHFDMGGRFSTWQGEAQSSVAGVPLVTRMSWNRVGIDFNAHWSVSNEDPLSFGFFGVYDYGLSGKVRYFAPEAVTKDYRMSAMHQGSLGTALEAKPQGNVSLRVELSLLLGRFSYDSESVFDSRSYNGASGTLLAGFLW